MEPGRILVRMEQTPPQVPLAEAEALKVERVQEAASKNASWGTIIVILVILTMIVTGAFYAWGQRIEKERELIRQYQESQPEKY